MFFWLSEANPWLKLLEGNDPNSVSFIMCKDNYTRQFWLCKLWRRSCTLGGSIFETSTFPNIEPWILSPNKTFLLVFDYQRWKWSSGSRHIWLDLKWHVKKEMYYWVIDSLIRPMQWVICPNHQLLSNKKPLIQLNYYGWFFRKISIYLIRISIIDVLINNRLQCSLLEYFQETQKLLLH